MPSTTWIRRSSAARPPPSKAKTPARASPAASAAGSARSGSLKTRDALSQAQVQIALLRPADRSGWEPLARGYKEFYKTPTTDAEFDTAWERLIRRDGVVGLGAKVDGRLVGIAHYLFHTSVWARKTCY